MGFSEDRARDHYQDIYLIIAENPYLLWDAVEHWRATCARADQGGECIVDTLAGRELNLDALAALVSARPLFAVNQLVIIKDIDKAPAKVRDGIVPILRNRVDSAKILMTAGSVDRRLKWIKDLGASVPVEEFPRVREKDISGWARRIAGDFGWSLSPQAVGRLTAEHGSDLFGIRQTIERATLFIGKPRRIEEADIEAMAAGDGLYNIFQLLEAVAAEDLSHALRMARGLQQAGGGAAASWIAAAFSHYQRLSQAVDIPEHMRDFDAARELGVQPFIATKMRQEAHTFGRTNLEEALSAVFEADWCVKTSTLPAGIAFELLIYRLCRRRTLTPRPWFSLKEPNTRE